MNLKKILLIGGSGFIGGALAEALAKRGYFVTVPTRQRERARHLLPLPTVEVIAADVFDRATLDALVRRHDVVINLLGILHGDFEKAHVAFPRMVAESCVQGGVKRLLHMSALNADPNGASQYLRSRGRGEAAVWAVANSADLAVTMFRPSVVFGEGDRFLNMFASLAKKFPLIPLGSPDARFQVVWVGDVARAIVTAIDLPETFGKTYPLAGPAVYTLHELLAFVIAITGARCKIISLGTGLSTLQAAVFEHLPGKLITRDNLASMSLPNTSAEAFPAIFGEAHAMESVVPGYMHGSAGRACYARLRQGIHK